MTTVSTSPLAVRIRAVLEEKSMLRHPFYQSWTRGDLPLAAMQEYARQYYHFEAAFPRLLSAIHARTESAEIRQSLLDNLWDEEHGPRNHAALWLEFAAALGLSSDDVTGAALRPQTAALIRHYDEAARDGALAEALVTLFAYEGQVPQIAWQKIKALSDFYGFTPEQFEFFSVHLVSDVTHAGHEMAAIEQSTEDDDRVIAATTAACERLLAFLDGCNEGMAA
jgi:pyrroloquinoline-quinone synthase